MMIAKPECIDPPTFGSFYDGKAAQNTSESMLCFGQWPVSYCIIQGGYI